MRAIFIGSTGGGAGQTLATWALARRLQEKGLKIGFFKPYGRSRPEAGRGGRCDPDVALFKRVLELSESEEALCPFFLPENAPPDEPKKGTEDGGEKIQGAFQEISRGKDVVLVMGAGEIFFGEENWGISDGELVRRFDASVLLVDRYQRDNLTFYSLLSLNSFLQGRVKTAILNHVSPDRLDHVGRKVAPFLKEKGLSSIVTVPEDPVLAGVTVAALSEWIGGEVISGPELGENLVHTTTIGSNFLEGPLLIFKQVYNKIILVGLDPSGAAGKPVAGVVLTGGKKPGEGILKVARDYPLPLILTRADTFQVMERLEKPRPALGWKDEFKMRRFLELIGQAPGAERWVEDLLR